MYSVYTERRGGEDIGVKGERETGERRQVGRRKSQ